MNNPKPLPDPLYGCAYCADEYSWPATELFWSERTCSWVCDNCWAEADEHWLTGNDLVDRGITLAEELKHRGPNHNQAKRFDEWWETVGSGLFLLPGEDAEVHAKRVARQAYEACLDHNVEHNDEH